MKVDYPWRERYSLPRDRQRLRMNINSSVYGARRSWELYQKAFFFLIKIEN